MRGGPPTIVFLCVFVFLVHATKHADSLKCDGGKLLKPEWINDGYCDCKDGRDEPLTSACVNAQFYCVNDGISPKHIPSQWVHDSICDCCDGSDEKEGVCLNQCTEIKKTLYHKEKDLLTKYSQGLMVKATLSDPTIEKEAVLAKADDLEQQLRSFEDEKKQLEESLSEGDTSNKGATTRIKQLERRIKDELRDIERIKIIDFGENDLFYPLFNTTLNFLFNSRNIKFQFFKDITQGSIKLGRFSRWEDNLMIYNRGTPCTQGNIRECRVEIQCGPETKIVSMEETSPCLYHVVMEYPAICNHGEYQEKLAQFNEKWQQST